MLAHASHRHGHAVVLALCAALVTQGSSSAGDHRDVAAHVEQVLAAADETASSAELARRLLEPGPDVTPYVVDALVTDLANGGGTKVSAALAAAVSKLPADRRREHLRRHLDLGIPSEVRAEVVKQIGSWGRATDLSLVLDFAAPEPRESSLPASLAQPLQGSVESIVGRDSSALGYIVQLLRKARNAHRYALVRAAAESNEPLAFRKLGALVGADAGLDRLIVAFLPRAAESAPRPLDASVVRAIRGRLTASDTMLARAAVEACVALDDIPALPALVTLMATKDRGLRRQVHRALGSLTGLGLPDNPDAWSAWLAGELDWSAENGERVSEVIRSGGPGEVLAVLRELGAHRLERDRWSSLATEALANPTPSVRRSACIALRRLGSPLGVQTLVERLEDPDPGVKHEAHRALRELTGLNLPPDAFAWRAEVGVLPQEDLADGRLPEPASAGN